MTDIQAPFLGFDELFSSVGVLGHEFSPRLAALNGKVVSMRGYLAPADHDGSGLLVLTPKPSASCSDCSMGHDWPEDAVFILTAVPAGTFEPGRKVEVRGRLEHGLLDVGGANSLVRLCEAQWTDAEGSADEPDGA